jgi:hypothetical protein
MQLPRASRHLSSSRAAPRTRSPEHPRLHPRVPLLAGAARRRRSGRLVLRWTEMPRARRGAELGAAMHRLAVARPGTRRARRFLPPRTPALGRARRRRGMLPPARRRDRAPALGSSCRDRPAARRRAPPIRSRLPRPGRAGGMSSASCWIESAVGRSADPAGTVSNWNHPSERSRNPPRDSLPPEDARLAIGGFFAPMGHLRDRRRSRPRADRGSSRRGRARDRSADSPRLEHDRNRLRPARPAGTGHPDAREPPGGSSIVAQPCSSFRRQESSGERDHPPARRPREAPTSR